MIPETSCELHLNLCDQSQLKSSQSHTCLTAPNTVCTQSVLVRWQTLHHHHYQQQQQHLTLSLPVWPRSTAAHAYCVLTARHLHHRAGSPTPLFPTALLQKNFLISAYSFHTCFPPIHVSVSAAEPHADGGICHPASLDEIFFPHMAAVLIPGCLWIFQDTTSTDFP